MTEKITLSSEYNPKIPFKFVEYLYHDFDYKQPYSRLKKLYWIQSLETLHLAYFDNQTAIGTRSLKFGSADICDAGCTIITLYNALLFCNLPTLRHFTAEEDDLLFPNLIAECEKKSLLFGHLGAFPTHIYEMLTKYDEIEVGPMRTSVEDLISDYGEFSMDCAIISTYINVFIPNLPDVTQLMAHTTLMIPCFNATTNKCSL